MDILSSSNRRIHESNLELFRARLAGRLCIAVVFAVQIITRFILLFWVDGIQHTSEILLLSSIPLACAILVYIIIEYFLFRKFQKKMMRYSNLCDIILLILFTAEWVVSLIASLLKIDDTDPPCFQVTGFYGFTHFAWRTLLVTLIVQSWGLKIIAPSIATMVATGYAIHYTPNDLGINLARGAFQLFNIIVIIYCEDKIKWRIIWRNLYQEKWVQVNNFILNNIPENIMILDMKGEIKFVSDYCKGFMKKCSGEIGSKELFQKIHNLQQLEYEPEEAMENSTTAAVQIERLTTHNELISENNLMRIETLEYLIENFGKIIEEKNIQERQFLVYNGELKIDEKDKSIEIKISWINHIENGYIVLILRDMTQRDLLVTLEENNKYKDQLLASVSHELRAPLNGNINMVEGALSCMKIPEDVKENLLIPALRSGKFLLHIINDILDMSQIKTKRLRLVFETKSLEETLKNAVQLVELQAKKKGIDLVLEFDPNLPKQFCTDHMRLSQIVLNLLSNAIKFTKDGAIKLKAILINESRWIKIIVEDSGVGIKQESLKKIFSSCLNIELEERQIINPAGVGFGLNIASNLAGLLAPKNHRGININSVENQGSIFSFIIENKERAPPEENSGSSLSWEIAEEVPEITTNPRIQKNNTSTSIVPLVEKSKCSCPKVLIVDDSPFNTMAFETILSSLEITCESVYSGPACIKKLLGREAKKCGKNCMSYSVVFMDQEMPEMNGCETVIEIRRLQRENQIPDIKIIGCTAHTAKEEVDRFFEAGLDECIFKPISVKMIQDILEEILLSD